MPPYGDFHRFEHHFMRRLFFPFSSISFLEGSCGFEDELLFHRTHVNYFVSSLSFAFFSPGAVMVTITGEGAVPARRMARQEPLKSF